MKRYFMLTTIIICVLNLPELAQSIPMYYTFEGNVTSIHDHAGIIAEAGLDVNDFVTYTFLVDYDATGWRTSNNGINWIQPDTSSVNYFYVDYISGSALSEKDGGVWNAPYNIKEYNYGEDQKNTKVYLWGNSQDDLIYIETLTNQYVSFPDWTLGMQVRGVNRAYWNDKLYHSWLDASLTLTQISNTPPSTEPIPEPTTILLVGAGLLGLVGLRRKMQK